MGKPAARLGDMTAHGGAIVGPGVPTVLIGGMPAATLGDMHVCPMVTPGVPPIPHVGGPITLGSMGVMIGKKPAARMGDMAICVGPPSTIILGCPTVLIGESSGGGGGGGGGAGGSPGGGSAAAGALASSSIAGSDVQPQTVENHFVHFVFEDKGKLPVGGMRYTVTCPDNSKWQGYLGRQIRRNGVPKGSYTVELRKIVNAQWSENRIDVNKTVELNIDTIGVPDGDKALIEICVRDVNYADRMLDRIEAAVKGNRVKAQWKMSATDNFPGLCAANADRKRYSTPYFFFKVIIDELYEQSGFLYIEDWVEIQLIGSSGKGLHGEKYELTTVSGEVIKGTLDADGKARIEPVPPGKMLVCYPDIH